MPQEVSAVRLGSELCRPVINSFNILADMFETLRIILFGRQPFAKVDSKTLERIIRREFGDRANEVKRKLQGVASSTPNDKNRISAAILKLADKDLGAVDKFIEINNNDFRDVLARAEYPRCSDLGFGELNKKKMKQVYLADWKDYSDWLNRV